MMGLPSVMLLLSFGDFRGLSMADPFWNSSSSFLLYLLLSSISSIELLESSPLPSAFIWLYWLTDNCGKSALDFFLIGGNFSGVLSMLSASCDQFLLARALLIFSSMVRYLQLVLDSRILLLFCRDFAFIFFQIQTFDEFLDISQPILFGDGCCLHSYSFAQLKMAFFGDGCHGLRSSL